MSRNFKVWLVEGGSALPAASGREGQLVRQGIRTRLDRWFTAALRHRSARRGKPAGRTTRCDVAWSRNLLAAQVDLRDVVIYFEASRVVQGRPTQTPSRTYHTAASNVRDTRLRRLREVVNPEGGVNGGLTVRVDVDGRMLPVFSVVYVLYNAQYPTQSMRVATNVETLTIAAFHEAAHNKDDTNSLHTAGGGGVFADIHTSGASATSPNGRNTAFLATRVWNAAPQYISGRPLLPVAVP